MFKAFDYIRGEMLESDKKYSLLEELDWRLAEYQQEFEKVFIYNIKGVYYIGIMR